jgi:tetratricopeptide (TPR) repeat protein
LKEILSTKAEYITNRGVIYQSMGDPISALQNYKLAIQLDPSYSHAYFNAANMYLGQQRWELAEEYYNKVLF